MPPSEHNVAGFALAFGTPRRLPKADALAGRVVVLDVAFASESGGRKKGFEKTTLKLIDQLGDRLAAWIDHHDSEHHARYRDDPRFVLAKKSEHGACPEMVTAAIVERVGKVDTIVCHTDFDGLASAAKWILGGREPYPGCDADARSIDTRTGLPGEVGARFDRAIRARPKSDELRMTIVEHLVNELRDDAGWRLIDEAGSELAPLEDRARDLAEQYEHLTDELVFVEATGDYDRTHLLLLGQQRATMALVVDGETATFAAPFDSGVNFLDRFGFSGGMPTLVSIHRKALPAALVALGVDAERAALVERSQR